MSLKDYQSEVDLQMKESGWEYWASPFMVLRLSEECGEVAREINNLYGPKKKKQEESRNELGSELADVIYTVICIANNNRIDLDTAWKDMMQKKIRGRDLHRYDNPASA
jgi:NTP pyrophosphatase (non-canonical NTP hydrolase)